MKSIDDLRALGYAVGVASGSVDVEIAAHDEAVEMGDPAEIAQKASAAAIEIVAEARAGGAEPRPGQTWEEVAQALTTQAYRILEEGIQERIAMHARAVELARNAPTLYAVSGDGFQLYVSIDDKTGHGSDEDSQKILESLADEEAIVVRRFQAHAPEGVVTAVWRLANAGVEIESATADGRGFSVKVPGAKAATTEESVAALVDRFVPADEGQE